MTPHKHADLLHAIAEGRKVEMRHSKDCPWYSPSYILRLLDDDAAGDGPTNYEFRIQPEIRTLAGHAFPEPVSVPLATETEYWIARPDLPGLCSQRGWHSSSLDDAMRRRGLIQPTEASAIAQARAIIAAIGGEL